MPRLRSSPISSSADQPLSWRNDAAYGDDNYCGWKEKKPAVGIPLGIPMKHWDYKDISSIYQLAQDFVTMRNISSRARNAQQPPSSMFALKKSARIKGTLSLWRMLWHGSVPGTPAGAGLGRGWAQVWDCSSCGYGHFCKVLQSGQCIQPIKYGLQNQSDLSTKYTI